MSSYKLDPDAEEELVAAMAWYDAEEEGLGLEFLEELHSLAQRAARLPNSGAPVEGSPTEAPLRRFLFTRFRHAIYTLVIDDTLLVFAVAHQHQKPGYWMKRLAKVQP